MGTPNKMISLPLRIRPSILLFGDSITQQGFGWTGTSAGWASLLARDYARRADVLNRGFSGYNTKMALEALPSIVNQDFTAHEILFATVFFGANDAALRGELQHVPAEEYGQNLASIVEKMRSNSATENAESENCTSDVLPIILFTPPPVDVDAWYAERGEPKDEGRRNDRANENAKLYRDIAINVGKRMNCSVLDVFDLLGGNSSAEEYGKHLRDGLHLSESGNVLVYEGLIELLRKDYPHLFPMVDGQGKYGETGIPLDGNLWRELC